VEFLRTDAVTFDTVFDRVIGHEGGYTNDPNDPGGETNWGITWPVLREAIGLGIILPETTIASLTRGQAKRIYAALFWDALNAEGLPDGVVFQLFDFAVNSGIGTAVRNLQRAVGVADDGLWGPVSRVAAARTSETDMVMRLNAERLDFLTRLKNWPHYGKGWVRRIAANLRYGALDS